MMRKPSPTIGTVATRAFVSKTTVSHVINGTRFVEEGTKQRVLQAIAELGYRPNTVARSLTTKRTGNIGMIVSDASNYFFGEMLRGVEEVLTASNYTVIVCNTDEELEREKYYLDLLLSQRVDGIIAAATTQKWSALTMAEAIHTPIVYVDRRFEGLHGPYVGADNIGGALAGARHLIERGYRDIGILAGFQRLSSMRERLQGFRQALDEAAIPLRPEWLVTSPLSYEAGFEAARQILSLPDRPRALFVNNNLLLLGALLAVREHGLRCPDELAILGFDDHPWAAVSNPPITVVQQPSRHIGRQAAKMLHAMIQGNALVDTQVELPCSLVVRESC
ncbi:MAG: LacI family DNA-binding transcriptional regulator [Caldilineaceae bacterium]